MSYIGIILGRLRALMPHGKAMLKHASWLRPARAALIKSGIPKWGKAVKQASVSLD